MDVIYINLNLLFVCFFFLVDVIDFSPSLWMK